MNSIPETRGLTGVMDQKERDGDRPEGEPEIKIVDRRTFASDGTPRDAGQDKSEGDPRDSKERPRPSPGSGAPGAPGGAAESRPRERETVRGSGFTMESTPEPSGSPAARDAAFVNLCVSLYQTGCIHLGLTEDGTGTDRKPDVEATRGTVEVLQMLQRKTRGNLSEEEHEILDSLLAELQMAYVMKVPGA
jgi:hypothetical protein